MTGGGYTLAETHAQVAWLASADADPTRRDAVIAVTPEAAFACQRLGVEYARLDDFIASSNRRAEYACAVPALIAWLEQVDDWARARIPAFGATAFRPAEAAAFRFLRVHGEIVATGRALTEWFDASAPSHVNVWLPESPALPLDLESPYNPVVSLAADLARERRITVRNLAPVAVPAEVASRTAPNRPSALASVRSRVLEGRLRPIAAAARSGGAAAVLRAILPAGAHARRVLACGFGYDVQRVVVELRRQGVGATQISSRLRDRALAPDVLADITASAGELTASPEMWSAIDGAGIARPQLWAAAVERWWCGVVPRLWSNYPDARALIGRGFDALVLADVGSADFASVVRQAASEMAVPVYLYQHGGSADLDAPSLLPWVTGPDALLVYGDGTAADLAETMPRAMPRAARIVPVGSTRLDEIEAEGAPAATARLRRALQGGDPRPLVLYVPTHFAPHFRAVSQLADHPVVPYFELLQRVLGVFAEASGVRLVFKEFGVANDTTRMVPSLVRDTVPDAVVTSTPIRDLMWAVDAIVVDHVITATTEVLLTGAPCVFYMPARTAQAERGRTLLRHAATVAETPDGFADAVRALVAQPHFHRPASRDRAFIQAYGTHRDDGHSARRAAAVIAARQEAP